MLGLIVSLLKVLENLFFSHQIEQSLKIKNAYVKNTYELINGPNFQCKKSAKNTF